MSKLGTEEAEQIIKQVFFCLFSHYNRNQIRNYLMFHTMDPVVAIEDLKEISRQKHKKK